MPAGVPAVVFLAGKELLLILGPFRGHHHVADLEIRVDAAGNAGEDQPGQVEVIRGGLGQHGGVDHADTAVEEHHLVPGQPAGDEGAPVDLVLFGCLHLLAERLHLRLEGRDDGQTGGVIHLHARVDGAHRRASR